MLEDKVEKGIQAEGELFQKYKEVLPEELMEIWQEQGWASMLNGYLRVINPDDYKALLDDTYFRGNRSIPIMTTAFGDIITFEDGQYIGMVKYKNGNFAILAKSFKRFLKNLADDYFLGNR